MADQRWCPILIKSFFEPQQCVLRNVRGKYKVCYLVSHGEQQVGALLRLNAALSQHRVDEDFNVDFMVGGVDASGVINGVYIYADTVECSLDTAGLGCAQIAAFTNNFGTKLPSIDANRIIGAIADLFVRFIGGFNVGADAAVVDQINGCLQ